MRAAIYCRVSTEDQEREGTSLDSQLEACLNKAHELGYEVPEELIFRETYSGLALDRPILAQLRALIRNQEIDGLIAYTLDRLSRDPVHFIILQGELERTGIKLVLVTETIDSSDLGKLITYIKGYAAKLEAEKIRERTMRGRMTRVRSGRLPGGRETKLYGCNYLPGKGIGEGIRYINEAEAKWVREIYRWLVEEGLSINRIVRRLRALTVPTPSGKGSWGKSTVHNILTNIAYTGKTYAFTQTQDEGGRHYKEIRKHKATHRLFKPREEWIEIPGATPPIISEELFNEAQARLQRNKELSPRHAVRQYLLSGYVFCRRCGRRYCGGAIPSKNKDGIEYRRYYRCPKSFTIISPAPCTNRSWNADYLEKVVWGQIDELLCKPEVVLAGLKTRESEAKQASFYLAELETVEVKLRHMEREKDRVWKAFELTGDEAKFAKEIKDVMARIGELEKQKLELERRIEASKQAEVDMDSIKRCCELVRSNLADFTFENKRLALQALNIKVCIDGENIAIEGAVPMGEDAIASTLS
jgi:site-specific DNA recombinase